MSSVYLSIVIPAYNERARLNTTIESVVGGLPSVIGGLGWEVLIVDDGSTDNTAQIVEEIRREESRIGLLRLPHRGKGAAVRAGMIAAQGDIILFSDADLATPFTEATKLLAAIDEGADIAIGSRAITGAQRLYEPFYREIMGHIFQHAVRVLLMQDFADTQCGFKAFRRHVAHDVFPRLQLYNDDSPILEHAAVTAFDVEVLFLANRLGYQIREVPIEWHYQTESKVNPLRDSYSMFRDVLTVRRNARRHSYRTAPLESTRSRPENPPL